MSNIPSLSDIKRAHQRIEKYITETPVLTSNTINEISGAEVFFKCENFQKGGSFKMRGASNMVFSFKPEERENGFTTHSSGNHAQAVAIAAKLAGVKAYVVMPKNSTSVKINAVRDYGGEVILCEPTEKARAEAAEKVTKETGAIFIPPFDDSRIIAGQATAAKELIESVENLDIIMSPIGGGGLAAGTALTAKYIDPTMEVILGEPKNADDAYQSFISGKRLPVTNPNTIADGLRTSVGELNFEIVRKHVKEIIPVDEQEIIDGMRLIWERMKIIIEPSCAVPFAALLQKKEYFQGKRVGIILTGGNVDLSHLPF